MRKSTSYHHEKIASDTKGIQSHYDLPVEFFAQFLGPRMAYSCAYFTHEDNSLEQAERDKLELVAQKIELKRTDKVLDIGCGWGSFLFFAAEEYDCEAVGITLSENQIRYINDMARKKGLSKRVRAQLIHAYEMPFPPEFFDKAVTIGTIEHIEDLALTFGKTNEILREPGLFLCHGMTRPWESRAAALDGETSEIGEIVIKHFGVGHWKSFWEIAMALEQSGFEMLDHENITPHYALTVTRWLDNLQQKESKIAGKIIPDEKYREFTALMAGYIVGFEMSYTICNQILCQKRSVGSLRPSRSLTREHMVLRAQEKELEETVSASSNLTEIEPSPPPHDETIREVFEEKLPEIIEKNSHELKGKIDSILTFRLKGNRNCSYTVNLKGEKHLWGIFRGESKKPDCLIEIEIDDFKKLLAQKKVTPWLEAFKARKIRFSGSLPAALKVQGLIKSYVKSNSTEKWTKKKRSPISLRS